MIQDVVIIGAGLSGSLLSSLFPRQRYAVLIVEKSKSIGGRLSSKPVGCGLADYGCQIFNPKSKEGKTLSEMLYKKRLLHYTNIKELKDSFICKYGLSKIPQYLSLDTPTLTNTRITNIKRIEGIWHLKSDNHIIKSRIVIFTMPPNQVSELLSENDLDSSLNIPKVRYHSFYTITFSSSSIFQFSSSVSNAHFAWIINNRKKGVLNSKNIYTVNTSDSFAKELTQIQINSRFKIIKSKLSNYGFRKVRHKSIHFWKYAYIKTKSNIKKSWNPDLGLGACGDGYGMGNIDGAITSSKSLYEKIISFLN